MTVDSFEEVWAKMLPLSPPISYVLRTAYPERWFRIHSLPESKRYPENDAEWAILLGRQNCLIEDLLGKGSKVWLVTGQYDTTNGADFVFTPDSPLDHLSFTALTPFAEATYFDEIASDEYADEGLYRPFLTEISSDSPIWKELLMRIANWELSAFFVTMDGQVVIAPYDGGVDVILKDEATRNAYREKYRDWLSAHESGL